MARVAITAGLILVAAALGGRLTVYSADGASHARAGSSVTALQARLAALGYLAPAAVSGRMDEATCQAVLAFQGWEGLSRDGVVGPATRARLAAARRPEAGPGQGPRIEINLTRQVALWFAGGGSCA
jgi:peptidoglycan hydrolase-like protein with peptidoglycan-binding domain